MQLLLHNPLDYSQIIQENRETAETELVNCGDFLPDVVLRRQRLEDGDGEDDFLPLVVAHLYVDMEKYHILSKKNNCHYQCGPQKGAPDNCLVRCI